jgi:hypothetical protein
MVCRRHAAYVRVRHYTNLQNSLLSQDPRSSLYGLLSHSHTTILIEERVLQGGLEEFWEFIYRDIIGQAFYYIFYDASD